ncbi:uncharacterized protein LOC144214901 isoform X2 [Stigmatopora nigra]
MARTGVCCANLEEPAALMKMGLSMVLGIVVGIVAIVLSKNKKSRSLTWSLFSVSLVSSLIASASAIGLLVSVVRAIIYGGRSLLTHCRFPDAIGYSSITNECPFDPTRIYSTTLILWVPLIVTCVVQFVFSARCLSASASFLGLPCWPYRKRRREVRAVIKAVRPLEELVESGVNKAKHRQDSTPLERYTQAPRTDNEPKRPPPPSQPVRQQRRQPPPTHHRSLPPAERRPLHQQPRWQKSPKPNAPQSGLPPHPEQRRLLERGALERSSFWI